MRPAKAVEMAKGFIDLLVGHDSTSDGEVEAGIAELKKHMDTGWAAAKIKRAEKEKARALPK